MLQKLPPLAWLRAFEAAARHLSFTQAAIELNLTQAAISKQIRLLEQYLQEPLFHRKPRSLVLTKMGAAYLPKLRDSLARLAAGTNEVFGNRRGEVLTIRAPIGYSVVWLVQSLGDFIDNHPKIPVRLVSSVWQEDFEREQLHLDIQYGNGFWPKYHADQLTNDKLFPVCAPSVIAGKDGLRTPDDLAQHRLLHVLGYADGWANWLNAAGTTGIHPGQGLQFDTSLLAFEFAATSGGVALARSSLVINQLNSGRLLKPFTLEVDAVENFYLLSPEDGTGHPHAAIFREWLLGQARVRDGQS